MQHFVIVGGGVAGHQAARGILATNDNAIVTMTSSEHHVPYDRPHLSKAFLNSKDEVLPTLAGSEIYADTRLSFLNRSRVEEIDPQSLKISLDDGRVLQYDKLILATGSRPRELPVDVVEAQPLYLRTADDALALTRQLISGATVLIIGGGFIGVEVAAAARKRGCKVILLEAQNRLLARAGSPELSRWVVRLCTANGVDIHLNTAVRRVQQLASGKYAVETSHGLLSAEVVVAGIGVKANVELAKACGLAVQDGIVVDKHCATSDAHVFAAGEVTNYPLDHLGIRTRSESWTAASDQGIVAGRAAAGDPTASYSQMPWLWSDQFDANIQSLGLADQASQFSSIGDLDSSGWLLLGWNTKGQLVSALAVNKPRDMSRIRRLISRFEQLPAEYSLSRTTPLNQPTSLPNLVDVF
jgi:NADPH-dependent 2,4-dienoyl-CoA reductase/sulfur reductase-like enzyme